MLTQEYLKTRLSYDEETGIFTWISSYHAYRIGTVAGSLSSSGTIHIHLNDKMYLAHRLAWLYVHGVFPSGVIDHRNHIRNDNKISNLRDVSSAINMKNKSKYKNNTSGFAGVTLVPDGRYRAFIGVNGKTKQIGIFDTVEEASSARSEYKANLGYHANHL